MINNNISLGTTDIATDILSSPAVMRKRWTCIVQNTPLFHNFREAPWMGGNYEIIYSKLC